MNLLELWESEDFEPIPILQTKIAENYISYRKLSGSISLSTRGVELGGSKDYHF